MLVWWQRWGVSVVSIEDAYVRYADDLVRYATLLVPRSAAADVVADTFADLLRHADGAWSTAQHPKGFLFGAVANRARMHHRQNARRRQRERQLVLASRQSAEGVVDDSSDELLAVLEGLSVQQRVVTSKGDNEAVWIDLRDRLRLRLRFAYGKGVVEWDAAYKAVSFRDEGGIKRVYWDVDWEKRILDTVRSWGFEAESGAGELGFFNFDSFWLSSRFTC